MDEILRKPFIQTKFNPACYTGGPWVSTTEDSCEHRSRTGNNVDSQLRASRVVKRESISASDVTVFGEMRRALRPCVSNGRRTILCSE